MVQRAHGVDRPRPACGDLPVAAPIEAPSRNLSRRVFAPSHVAVAATFVLLLPVKFLVMMALVLPIPLTQTALVPLMVIPVLPIVMLLLPAPLDRMLLSTPVLLLATPVLLALLPITPLLIAHTLMADTQCQR
ncbi:hypothetical protein P43SY_011313 [Pythium insidiosum]|uniref:Uncharacterized protein n=1 Tax=Pythium insidiosum TaxID=114742 RepID=A0AAD5Q172_PYTIN|nr:hypothetical protein P43SY_011313 [Pythium insidiosum]